MAEVTALSRSGYTWNKLLDPTPNDTDLDGDNLPDQQFTVSGSAGAKGALPLLASDAISSSTRNSAAVASDAGTAPKCTPHIDPSAIDQAIVAFTKNHNRRLAGSYDSAAIGKLLDELFAAI